MGKRRETLLRTIERERITLCFSPQVVARISPIKSEGAVRKAVQRGRLVGCVGNPYSIPVETLAQYMRATPEGILMRLERLYKEELTRAQRQSPVAVAG